MEIKSGGVQGMLSRCVRWWW